MNDGSRPPRRDRPPVDQPGTFRRDIITWVMGLTTGVALGALMTGDDSEDRPREDSGVRQGETADLSAPADEVTPLEPGPHESEVFGHAIGIENGVVFTDEGSDEAIAARRGGDDVATDRMYEADGDGATLTLVAVAPDRDRGAEYGRELLDAAPRERDPDQVRIFYPSGGDATEQGDGSRSPPAGGVDGEDVGAPRGEYPYWNLTPSDIELVGLGPTDGVTVLESAELVAMSERQRADVLLELSGEENGSDATLPALGAAGAAAAGDDGSRADRLVEFVAGGRDGADGSGTTAATTRDRGTPETADTVLDRVTAALAATDDTPEGVTAEERDEGTVVE